jgi:hypothetical protein
MRLAEENASWDYRRIQGALANPGHHIDKITVRNILRRHDIDPAPIRHRAGMSWSQFLKIHWDVLTATGFFTVDVVTLANMRASALALGRDLVTRCIHLAILIHHGILGVIIPWVQQLHNLRAGCLPTTTIRVWLAACDLRCLGVFGTRRRGSSGQLRVAARRDRCGRGASGPCIVSVSRLDGDSSQVQSQICLGGSDDPAPDSGRPSHGDHSAP